MSKVVPLSAVSNSKESKVAASDDKNATEVAATKDKPKQDPQAEPKASNNQPKESKTKVSDDASAKPNEGDEPKKQPEGGAAPKAGKTPDTANGPDQSNDAPPTKPLVSGPSIRRIKSGSKPVQAESSASDNSESKKQEPPTAPKEGERNAAANPDEPKPSDPAADTEAGDEKSTDQADTKRSGEEAKSDGEGEVESKSGPPKGRSPLRGPSSRRVHPEPTAKVHPAPVKSNTKTAVSAEPGPGSATMPDVLKATEVHSGSVFPNERHGVTGNRQDAYEKQPDDEAYIPISFAQTKIEELTEKLMAMREEHHSVLAQMSAKYEERQSVAKTHYTGFVKRIQAAAVKKVQATQALLDTANERADSARAKLMAAHAQEVQAMQDRLATDSRETIDKQQSEYRKQIEDAASKLSEASSARDTAQGQLAEVTKSLADLKDQFEKASVEIASSRELFEKRVISLQVQSDKDRERLKSMNNALKQTRSTTATLLAQAAVTIQALESDGKSGAAPQIIQAVAPTSGSAVDETQLREAQDKVAELETQLKTLQEEADTLKQRLKLHEDAAVEATADGGDDSPSAKQLIVVKKEMSLLETKLGERSAELEKISTDLRRAEAASQEKISSLETEIKELKRSGAAAVGGAASNGDEAALQKRISELETDLADARANAQQLSQTSKSAGDSAGDVANLRDKLSASQKQVEELEARLKAREEASAAENGGTAMVPASELDVLSKSLENSRHELEEARSALVSTKESAQKDIVALEEQIAKLREAGSGGKAPSSDGAAEQALREQVAELEASLAKQKAHVKETDAKCVALAADAAEGSRLAADLDAKEKELVEMRGKIAELEATVAAALQAQESGEKVDSEALSKQVAELKSNIEAQSQSMSKTKDGAALASLEAKNTELEAQLARMKDDYASLQQQKRATSASGKRAAPPPPARKKAGAHHQADPAVLAKAVQEYTDRIDSLEAEKSELEAKVAALEMANAAAASAAAAAAGDSGDPNAAANAKAAAAASLKMAEESAAKSAEIAALKEEVESLQTERDGLLAKLAAVQAAGASAANDTAEARVARPVAAQLAGVRAEAMGDLQGKKFSAAKNSLTAGVKSALEELQSGGAESAHTGLKKLYSTALKKKGAAGVAKALEKAVVNFVVEFGDAALLSAAPSSSAGGSSGGKSDPALKGKLDAATKELKALKAELKAAKSAKDRAVKEAEKSFADEKKQLTKDKKATAVKIRQLEAALEKAEKNGAGAAAAKAAAEEKAKLEKKLSALAKKHKAELEAIAATHATAAGKLELQLKKAEKALAHCKEDLDEMTAEMKKQKKVAESIGTMKEEMESLQAKAAELEENKKTMKQQTKRMTELEALYKKESVLRKRYWNMMEDMKGKIRVYCRCRPFAQYEIDRKCESVVDFPDDVTIKVRGDREDKEFIYDQCFAGTSTQEEVFEDTRRLVQSAMDGFNVCVFAYGQTGSGKTWTMVGKPEINQGGLTPRSIDELFLLADETKKFKETTVSCYMIEIYNDNLVDLLYLMTMKEKKKKVKKGSEPKLDIKKDSKGMVVIQGAIILECPDAARTMQIFNAGNKVRHVGATKMNAESSRSHLIFAVLVKVYDKQTKKTANGKFSFIDLAGSERAGKTGATADRLKEAMSINKSLSALGNVISALSTGEKFIPYRDNKLTLVMSDSLGGNAKTLMFVNVSPADYNQEETLTSLVYASRVKLITNEAKQEQDTAEITRLKKIISNLRKGVPEDEGLAGGGTK